MNTPSWINVKVRFKGERRWHFLSTGGRVSYLRIHAATVDTVHEAKTLAADLVGGDGVVASRVVVDGRTVARFGEPTPPATKPVYGPAGGYTYLVAVTSNGHPVFHVRDGDDWGIVTEEIYEACHEEAKRAGLPRKRLNIYGRMCLLSTHGLVFHQTWKRTA